MKLQLVTAVGAMSGTLVSLAAQGISKSFLTTFPANNGQHIYQGIISCPLCNLELHH